MRMSLFSRLKYKMLILLVVASESSPAALLSPHITAAAPLFNYRFARIVFHRSKNNGYRYHARHVDNHLSSIHEYGHRVCGNITASDLTKFSCSLSAGVPEKTTTL